MRTSKRSLVLLLVLCSCNGGGDGQPKPGDTDFTTEEREGGGRFAGERAGGFADSAGAPGAPGAPGGRMADVQEADIYRVSGNRLFYLNTYRGFLIYDLTDPKKPAKVSRLPVFGHPIEMFVEGNTVHALLRDALYLTQAQGKLEFARHNVSQMVSIDVSDVAHPRVIKTTDIIGQLREGVSRKIENTIYVVSYIPQHYSWDWNFPGQKPAQKEQAWVYSFDVADPAHPRKVQELKLFEGGSVEINDRTTSISRTFSGVAISATSNALMVVENWDAWAYSTGGRDDYRGCGFGGNSQQAIVSVVDVSDPRGAIRLHTRFETTGHLTDQFKMTYVFDPASKAGTFYGIFARQEWSSSNCQGTSTVRNTLESWDVTNGARPARLGSLAFGKPNETVRGSAFDVDRKVVYAITARQIDPLYALGFADPRNLKVLSAIDGLSGDMNVFRLVGDNKFLIGIGQDTSATCTGFVGQESWQNTKVAVSVIDVRDLSRIRLVQRQCVAVKNAAFIGSEINQNLDQAHKMIGMHSDGQVNAITVPVYYYKKAGRNSNDNDDWGWYRYETAVGIMAWDLDRYDDRLAPTQQTVLQNFGTFVHPDGQVRRSIVFTHQASGRRMMVNLSDTHISVADLQDMANPQLQSIVEVAPYQAQVYRFGDHIVEYVESGPAHLRGPGGLTEFRVKPAGGDIEDRAPVATFAIGQVQRVLKHGDNLVLFRIRSGDRGSPTPATEVLVIDFSNPRNPRAAGSVRVPATTLPYYRYWCGPSWGGYWFGDVSDWAETTSGFVFLSHDYHPSGDFPKLTFLDVRDPSAPKVEEVALPAGSPWSLMGLVSDPSQPGGFFLWNRNRIGESRFKYYAERWEEDGAGKWSSQSAVNIPGHLVKTWVNPRGERMFLTQDQTHRMVKLDRQGSTWRSDMRLGLLHQIELGGRPAAQLLDLKTFTDQQLGALVLDGDRLFLNSRPDYFYAYAEGGPAGTAAAAGGQLIPRWDQVSDRLTIFDLSTGKLKPTYDRPLRAVGTQIMGTYRGNLFLNLSGDGILVVDVSNPTAPVGTRFLRTLGHATHIEFANDDAYVAAGHFGVYHLDLRDPSQLAID